MSGAMMSPASCAGASGREHRGCCLQMDLSQCPFQDIPGHYMALPELIVSTVANGRQASWRPSNLIEEAIHALFVAGSMFFRLILQLLLR